MSFTSNIKNEISSIEYGESEKMAELSGILNIAVKIYDNKFEIYSENISVKLKFNKSIAFQVYDEFYDEVKECDDGSLYVEAELPNNDILYTKLLSFGDDVEVLEPESVREKIREKLENMFKKYL